MPVRPQWHSRGDLHAEVRGALYVTDPNSARMFDDNDEELLLTLAKHASKLVETEWY